MYGAPCLTVGRPGGLGCPRRLPRRGDGSSHPTCPSEDLTAALNDVSGRSSPPAQVVATALGTDGPRLHETLGLLAGAAVLTLLIAFANVAGLLLLRSIDRRRELALRTALGARPSEIARQLVLEAEMLVAVGIAGGVARVMAHASRRPSCPGAIRRSREPRGGSELAGHCFRGTGRGGLCRTLWTVTGLCRITRQCGRRAVSRRDASSA